MTRACRCREAKFPAGVMCSGSRGSSAPRRLPGPGPGGGAVRRGPRGRLGGGCGHPARHLRERRLGAVLRLGMNVHESLAPRKLRRQVSSPAVGRSVGRSVSLPL